MHIHRNFTCAEPWCIHHHDCCADGSDTNNEELSQNFQSHIDDTSIHFTKESLGLSNFATKGEIANFCTKQWVEGKGYLTSAILNGYVSITDLPSLVQITPKGNGTQVIATVKIGNGPEREIKAPVSTGGGNTGGNSTSVKSYHVSVYQATSTSTTAVNAPDGGIYNLSTGKVSGLSDWYSTPAEAKSHYSQSKCQIWVSHNNFLSDNTNTGWTTPVKYLDVSEIINDAKTEAQNYYNQQLTNAESELNSIITDANDKLQIAQNLLDSIEDGGDISAVNLEISKVKSQITAYGWKVDGSTVTYTNNLLDAAAGRIKQEISKANVEEGSVKAAIRDMMANFIKDYVYNYENGKIEETYLSMTPQQIVLSAISATSDEDDVDDAIQTALAEIIKNRITLSITNNESGTGTSFSLKLSENGESDAILDASNFTVTGQMVADAITSNEFDITRGAATIYANGSAQFGYGTTRFGENGEGCVAGGNIAWDEDGHLTLKNVNIVSTEYKQLDFVLNNKNHYVATITEPGNYYFDSSSNIFKNADSLKQYGYPIIYVNLPMAEYHKNTAKSVNIRDANLLSVRYDKALFNIKAHGTDFVGPIVSENDYCCEYYHFIRDNKQSDEQLPLRGCARIVVNGGKVINHYVHDGFNTNINNKILYESIPDTARNGFLMSGGEVTLYESFSVYTVDTSKTLYSLFTPFLSSDYADDPNGFLTDQNLFVKHIPLLKNETEGTQEKTELGKPKWICTLYQHNEISAIIYNSDNNSNNSNNYYLQLFGSLNDPEYITTE